MHLRAQLRTRAQAGKGADQRALTHAGTLGAAVDMGKGVDDGVCGYRAIRQHAVGANAHAVAQRHVALKNAVHVNFYVHAAQQAAAHVQARRVGQAHAGFHQR